MSISNDQSERNQATINKYISIKRNQLQKKDKRPTNPKHVKNISDCEIWRSKIIKEISNKIVEIQNTLYEEDKIKAVNDKINILLNEKDDWEERILQLGGKDYRLDDQGEMKRKKGEYMYFGRARELPGVRELYEIEKVSAPKLKIEDMYKNINKFYFEGYDNFNDFNICNIDTTKDENNYEEEEEEIDNIIKSINNYNNTNSKDNFNIVDDILLKNKKNELIEYITTKYS
jgi:pre-mRNA-splicing factor ISY1